MTDRKITDFLDDYRKTVEVAREYADAETKRTGDVTSTFHIMVGHFDDLGRRAERLLAEDEPTHLKAESAPADFVQVHSEVFDALDNLCIAASMGWDLDGVLDRLFECYARHISAPRDTAV